MRLNSIPISLLLLTFPLAVFSEITAPYKSNAHRTEIITKLKEAASGRPCDKSNFDDAQKIRIIYPGDAIITDFVEDRMNVEVDKNGKFIKSYCG